MEKRTWHYLMPPWIYDMRCDKCWDEDLNSGKGTNIEWSEYERHIWCYDCEIDTKGFQGIFDGPIPIQAAYMMGLSFDRYNLLTKEIERYNLEKISSKESDSWDPPSEWTIFFRNEREQLKRALRDEKFTDPYGDFLREQGREKFSTSGFSFDLEEILSCWVKDYYENKSTNDS